MTKVYKKPFIAIINLLGARVRKKDFSKEPIYIGGCGRSGTTLLLSIISSHPEVFACPEELRLFDKVETDQNGRSIPQRWYRLHRTLLLKKIKSTANRWCEKSPTNILKLKDIESYHQAKFKFLNIVRDGRDVILSKHPTAPGQYWVDPERWIRDVGAGYEAREHPNVMTVRYEDLILDFEPQIKNICEFLDIPVCDEILNWHDHADVRTNRAYHGKVQNIFADSIGKWKKEEHIERAKVLTKEPEAEKLLQFYGYLK